MSDRCAACFTLLTPAPMGGRYACQCRPPNAFRHLRGSYWSEAVPEAPNTDEARLISKFGSPTLHLYGRSPRP